MISAIGSLTIINAHADEQVFWNGKPVLGVLSLRVATYKGKRHVKFKVNGTNEAMYAEMVAAGITVKKVKA